jgi:hypothetical protein
LRLRVNPLRPHTLNRKPLVRSFNGFVARIINMVVPLCYHAKVHGIVSHIGIVTDIP